MRKNCISIIIITLFLCLRSICFKRQSYLTILILVRMNVKQCTYHSLTNFSSTGSITDQFLCIKELSLAQYLETLVVQALQVPAQFQLAQFLSHSGCVVAWKSVNHITLKTVANFTLSITVLLLQPAPTCDSWVNLTDWTDGHSQGSDMVADQNECVHDVLCEKGDRNFSHMSHKYMDALLCEFCKL
jgi:hypothetical protein